MFKRLSLISLVMASLTLSISCASKKKQEEPAKDQAAQAENENAGKMDPNVGTKDINFDPSGSDGGKISGLVSVHFDYDSSTLSTESRRQLSDNAEFIKANPKVTVQIEGHCDSRGSVEYNLALGERRAKAVKNYMVSLGIDSKRLTIISYGEEKPIDPADNEQAYAKNRRANFVPLAQ